MTTHFRTPSGWKRTHPHSASGDRHGAVLIGAQHGRPMRPELRDRPRRGVPVPVVGTDRDDRQAWPDPVLEAGVLVRRSVMGDLEHVHRAQFRMLPQKCFLGRGFEVAEQQERQARGAHQQGDARVVGPVRRRSRRRGPQHLPLQRPEPPPLPRHRRHDGHPGPRRRPPDRGRLPGRLLQHGGFDHTHGPPPQHPGNPSHVVGVEVRQQEQRDPAHAQGAQALVDRSRLGPGVDHDGRTGTGGEHPGVALPHGALDVAPVRRRPAGDGTDQLRRPQHRDQQQHGHGGTGPAPPPEPEPEPHHGRRGRGQQQPAREPAGPGQLRPRQPGPAPRHGGDPPGGHPRAPGQQLRHGHGQRRHGEGREAEHGGGARRRLRQEVARHGDQAHPGGEHRHHRGAHGLRREGRPQGVGEARRGPAPPQGRAPARAEGEQRPGGQHREEEPDAAGEPRVVQHEQQHGPGQRREEGPAPPGGEGQQGDRPAGGGPQHARVGPAHHHEGQRQCRAAQGGGPQREPQPRREPAPLGVLRAGR